MLILKSKMVWTCLISFVLGMICFNLLIINSDDQNSLQQCLQKKQDFLHEIKQEMHTDLHGSKVNQSNIFKIMLAYLGIQVENSMLKKMLHSSSSHKCAEIISASSSLPQKHPISPEIVEKVQAISDVKVDGNKPSVAIHNLNELRPLSQPKIWLTPLPHANIKDYLNQSKSISENHLLGKFLDGKLKGYIILSNNKKLLLKIRCNFRVKNKIFHGKSYIQISDAKNDYYISSLENGKNSIFRIDRLDEVPTLIIKIRPSFLLRLQFNYIESFFFGKFYSFNNNTYNLIGEISKLQKQY